MTAVDPRTIALNALRWAHANGWRRASLYWTNRDGTIAVDLDREGVSVSRRAGALKPWGMARAYRCDSPTEAIGHLVAAGVLPVSLSTGYQLAGQEWAGEVRKAREARDLAEQHTRQAVAELAEFADRAAKVAAEQETEIARLKAKLGEGRYHLTEAGYAAAEAGAVELGGVA